MSGSRGAQLRCYAAPSDRSAVPGCAPTHPICGGAGWRGGGHSPVLANLNLREGWPADPPTFLPTAGPHFILMLPSGLAMFVFPFFVCLARRRGGRAGRAACVYACVLRVLPGHSRVVQTGFAVSGRGPRGGRVHQALHDWPGRLDVSVPGVAIALSGRNSGAVFATSRWKGCPPFAGRCVPTPRCGEGVCRQGYESGRLSRIVLRPKNRQKAPYVARVQKLERGNGTQTRCRVKLRISQEIKRTLR